MWIWRSKFDKLARERLVAEMRVEYLQGRIKDLEDLNLNLQDQVQALRKAGYIPEDKEYEYTGGDPFVEDEEAVKNMITNIRQLGRDAVIAQELRNG